MPGPAGLAICYGLSAALCWGVADFSAGFAAKKNSVCSVLVLSQSAGLVLLLVLALVFAEPLSGPRDILIGAVAGICGACGCAMLYKALASGHMGVAAPFAAISAAGLPVLFSMLLEGLPSAPHLVGIALALAAVWLLSGGGAAIRGKNGGIPPELLLSFGAGVGFAGFFICIDQTSDTAFFWPLLFARVASIALFSLVGRLRGQLQIPSRRQGLLMLWAGLMDAGGNVFFALAAGVGRLDVAAVLSSLCPGIPVVLAFFLLGERLRPAQWGGVAAALTALLLIAW